MKSGEDMSPRPQGPQELDVPSSWKSKQSTRQGGLTLLEFMVNQAERPVPPPVPDQLLSQEPSVTSCSFSQEGGTLQAHGPPSSSPSPQKKMLRESIPQQQDSITRATLCAVPNPVAGYCSAS
jgi:hypothetical protein